MYRYNLYCTEEQTKKALELGAPIETWSYRFDDHSKDFFAEDGKGYSIPTAEQMIGWLRTKGFVFYIAEYKDHVFWRIANNHDKIWYKYDDNLKDANEATLAAIDAALEYLIKMKGE